MDIQKVKEIKKNVARFIRIGELAQKAGIDILPTETLLGGFLELANNTHNHDMFFKKGTAMLKNEHTITFIKLGHKPEAHVLSNLRLLKFFFDPFNLCLFGPSCNKFKVEQYLNLHLN